MPDVPIVTWWQRFTIWWDDRGKWWFGGLLAAAVIATMWLAEFGCVTDNQLAEELAAIRLQQENTIAIGGGEDSVTSILLACGTVISVCVYAGVVRPLRRWQERKKLKPPAGL